jgi:3-oxoacyl-(acyl-carrier-protein) synthase
MYINGKSCISFQNSIDEEHFFETIKKLKLSRVLAQEPDYKSFVPGNLLRRMSHVIKMGVAAAKKSLAKAGTENIDAIITGTGLGCYEDTDKFLRSMIENNETLLTPTSFIQSTHNTVGGQIALLIKCYNYNFTYTQQGHSFENALIDAQLFLQENKTAKVLAGALDEAVEPYYHLLEQAGHIKNEKNKGGFCLGEGAAFFVLSNEKTEDTKARIISVKTFSTPKNSEDLQEKASAFLRENNLLAKDIDVILSGNSGDVKDDVFLNEMNQHIFSSTPICYFKELCGEYFTASAFALWLAALIVEKQKIPNTTTQKKVKTILIANQFCNNEYSFILLSAC